MKLKSRKRRNPQRKRSVKKKVKIVWRKSWHNYFNFVFNASPVALLNIGEEDEHESQPKIIEPPEKKIPPEEVKKVYLNLTLLAVLFVINSSVMFHKHVLQIYVYLSP